MSYYLSTLRHLTAAQVWHRSHRTIRRRWWRITSRRSPKTASAGIVPHSPLYSGVGDVSQAVSLSSEIEAASARAHSIADNSFCFLHRQVSFDEVIRWHDPELSHLWRYHLHYFNYVRDLIIWAETSERELAYRTFRRLALSWIENNQLISGDGWHPYTISLRVVNWLHALSYFSGEIEADRQTSDLIRGSAHGQMSILASDLELDVRGNHLLENLRALVWAGVAFEGAAARRWLEAGMRHLEVEVAEQVLSDGGHFERSPGYQLVVLQDLLEISLWLKRNTGAAPLWLDDAVKRMRAYTWNILAPDNSVPLLKDTAWDAAPNPLDLLTACALYFDEPAYKCSEDFGLYPLLLFGSECWKKFKQWRVGGPRRPSVALQESGHYVLRDDERRDYLILDAGKTCADYLPAHGQADSLTYELVNESERIIVDSGVYEYTAGAWRDFFRSTRAHNTVEVERENQSEVWSSFRVARRAYPGPVHWQDAGDYVLVQAEHDGYLRLSTPVVHQRTILWRRQSFWVVIDQLWGKGKSSGVNFVHLHPSFSFEVIKDDLFRIGGTRAALWVTTFGARSYSIIRGQSEPVRQGWYSERFGEIQPNEVLALHQEGDLPLCSGYLIASRPEAKVQATMITEGHEIKLTYGDFGQTLRLVRGSSPEIL